MPERRVSQHRGQDMLSCRSEVVQNEPDVEQEEAELGRAPVPSILQVHSVVAGAVDMLRVAVVIAVPDTVDLVRGSSRCRSIS